MGIYHMYQIEGEKKRALQGANFAQAIQSQNLALRAAQQQDAMLATVGNAERILSLQGWFQDLTQLLQKGQTFSKWGITSSLLSLATVVTLIGLGILSGPTILLPLIAFSIHLSLHTYRLYRLRKEEEATALAAMSKPLPAQPSPRLTPDPDEAPYSRKEAEGPFVRRTFSGTSSTGQLPLPRYA